MCRATAGYAQGTNRFQQSDACHSQLQLLLLMPLMVKCMHGGCASSPRWSKGGAEFGGVNKGQEHGVGAGGGQLEQQELRLWRQLICAIAPLRGHPVYLYPRACQEPATCRLQHQQQKHEHRLYKLLIPSKYPLNEYK